MKRPFKQRVDFSAQGKGPLELPRLTNLGPMSETSTDIGEFVFRGASLDSLNDDEFVDNSVSGREINMWYLDSAAAVKKYNIEDFDDALFQFGYSNASDQVIQQAIVDDLRIAEESINDFGVDTASRKVRIKDLQNAELISKKVTRHVTGGLSSVPGSSNRFAKPGKSPPLVMFLEKNRIPARLIKATYDGTFSTEHPAIAGAIDKGSKMLLAPRVNSDLTHTDNTDKFSVSELTEREFDSKRGGEIKEGVSVGDLVVNWSQNPLSNYPNLDIEKELFAYSTEIDLDSSLFGICTYFTDSKLRTYYTRFVDNNFIRYDNATESEYRNQIKQMYSYIKNQMSSYEDRLVLLVHKKGFDFGDRKISRRNVLHFYDGEQFADSYEQTIPFSDPSKF